MSVRYRPHHSRHKPWQATAKIREMRLDVYVGGFATKEEARQAVRDWYLQRYGTSNAK